MKISFSEFLLGNFDKLLAAMVLVGLILAMLHVSHDTKDGAVLETLKSSVSTVIGWLGILLTGRYLQKKNGNEEKPSDKSPKEEP